MKRFQCRNLECKDFLASKAIRDRHEEVYCRKRQGARPVLKNENEFVIPSHAELHLIKMRLAGKNMNVRNTDYSNKEESSEFFTPSPRPSKRRKIASSSLAPTYLQASIHLDSSPLDPPN